MGSETNKEWGRWRIEICLFWFALLSKYGGLEGMRKSWRRTKVGGKFFWLFLFCVCFNSVTITCIGDLSSKVLGIFLFYMSISIIVEFFNLYLLTLWGIKNSFFHQNVFTALLRELCWGAGKYCRRGQAIVK